MAIQRVCAGYCDRDGNKVECGVTVGYKKGGSGVSHTYCDNCFAAQMEIISGYTDAMTLNLANGTGDFGNDAAVKYYREEAVKLASVYYKSA